MSESLREQLSQAFDNVTQAEPAPQTEVATPAPEPTEAAPAEPAPLGRTAGRERDASGRLLPGPAKREDKPVQAAPAPAPEPKRIQRPSTWKKDHWESFDKLATENPALAEYINQRESEYAKGVSTYKSEWDRVKPILDVLAPFQQEIASSGLTPDQHVQKLLQAHVALTRSSPEQRLQMFAQFARDYQVPLQSLIGQDGQINQQALQQSPQPQFDPRQVQAMVNTQVQQALQQQSTAQEIESFKSQKDKYPHFEEVRETMAGLLQAGLAQGLQDAYDTALRHPRHAALYESLQEQQRKAEEERVAEEKRKTAETARRKVASPRTNTPTSAVKAGDKKGLRATIEAAFDEQVANRV